MANEPINIYKLIILYMLSKVKTPLLQETIFEFIINRGYTNYFTTQSALGDLLQAKLVHEDTTYHLSYFTLTKEGKDTLDMFGSPLSFEIRQEIDAYLKTNKKEILEESSLISDYHRTKDGTYLTSCTLRDGNHTLFHIELDVTTEADAIQICENWKKESEKLYQQAMVQLLNHH